QAGLQFTRHELPLPSNTQNVATAIANVQFLDLNNDGKLDVVGSDMRSDFVYAGLARNDFRLEPLAHLNHPAHIEQVDLDKDGLKDLIVADPASFHPGD